MRRLSQEGVLAFLLRLGSETSDETVSRSVAQAVANFARLSTLLFATQVLTDLAFCHELLLRDSSFALLSRWAASQDSQLHDCVAQSLLSLSACPGSIYSLFEAGGLSLLTTLARTKPSAATTLALTRTFANLTADSCHEVMTRAGETSKLLSSLSAVVATSPEAHLCIAKAVTDLAREDSGKALVVQSGWLEQLVGLSRSASKPVRLQVALALLNLVQADEIATKIMQEFGFPLFTSLADINDLEVQRVVERCLEKLNSADTLEERIVLDEYCVLPDD